MYKAFGRAFFEYISAKEDPQTRRAAGYSGLPPTALRRTMRTQANDSSHTVGLYGKELLRDGNADGETESRIGKYI